MIKFKYSFYILFSFILSFINVQKAFAKNTIQNSNTTTLNCSEYFYDTGGVDGNYSDNESYTTTFCPDNVGDIVIASFGFFEIENNYDTLKIYDGGDNTYPLIGEFTGTASPDIIVATIENGGCLTFEFLSDFSINFGGWEAFITCETPSSCIAPSEFILTGITESTANLYIAEINEPGATSWEIEYGIEGFVLGTGTVLSVNSNNISITGLAFDTTYKAYVRSLCSETEISNWSMPVTFSTNVEPPSCGELFYDSGSATENYSNNENSTVTICPENINELLTVSFVSFDLEDNYDKLYIYDGSNNTYPLIGEFTGTSSPGVITSTIANGGCLTFVFVSDYSVTRAGWVAQVYCGDAPTCYTPSEIIVDGVTDNSVYLYITEINSPLATSWDIEYGITGFTKGTGTVITTDSDFTEVTSLSSGTTYDAYVRSICDVDDESLWTPKVTFTTTGVLANNEYHINTFSISPNPVKGILTIKLNNSKTKMIEIFNLEGQLLLSKKSISNTNELNITNFNEGIYFLKITTENQSFIDRFIKL